MNDTFRAHMQRTRFRRECCCCTIILYPQSTGHSRRCCVHRSLRRLATESHQSGTLCVWRRERHLHAPPARQAATSSQSQERAAQSQCGCGSGCRAAAAGECSVGPKQIQKVYN